MTAKDHFVQFYDDDTTIVEAVASYFAFGLRFGEGCGLVATPSHTNSIIATMRDLNCDVDDAIVEGRFIAVDAATLLAEFMVDGKPDETLFRGAVGDLVKSLSNGKRPVRLFGEMVALLATDGKFAEAIELEQLWNKLAGDSRFRLFCAYPQTLFTRPGLSDVISDICSSHSRTLAMRMPEPLLA